MTTQTLPRTGMQSLMPILTIGLLFFIFGFVTWLNGALIPFLQMVCELSEMEALFIAFCFYVAYVVMALPMAKILEVTGYKKGMSLGCGRFFPWHQTQPQAATPGNLSAVA